MTEKRIIIKNSCNADGRTSKNITEETLKEATIEHIHNVNEGMDYIASLIEKRGYKHDHTKIKEHFPLFKETVLKGLSNAEFKQSERYQNHIHTERHHLNANAPADVNLIDVIEMLVDCVMAGKGRSGYISSYYCKIQDPTLLERAYWNTIKLLDDIVEVKGRDVEWTEDMVCEDIDSFETLLNECMNVKTLLNEKESEIKRLKIFIKRLCGDVDD